MTPTPENREDASRDIEADGYEPHDRYCLCGEDGHPHDCTCEKCQTYKYYATPTPTGNTEEA